MTPVEIVPEQRVEGQAMTMDEKLEACTWCAFARVYTWLRLNVCVRGRSACTHSH